MAQAAGYVKIVLMKRKIAYGILTKLLYNGQHAAFAAINTNLRCIEI